MIPPAVRHQRLTITLHARDHAGHQALATELLARARRANLAGATLLAGSPVAHGAAAAPANPSLRLLVVDEARAIDRFLADTADLLVGKAMTLEDVTAFRA